MTNYTTVRLFCVIFSLLLTLATLSAAPYPEYDTDIHDLYKMLLQQDSMDNQLGIHQMERRARGPQLRLRFGKRADELEHFMMKSAANERPPSLRLRFGKRSEDTPLAAYLNGLSPEGDN
ncbi:unnamed protein product [Phaedon cochleariae]|uniref:Short neuropeptide F n=1 Tax=Phaedon cochleariae TaxID=80249 RepID=A0A9P0GU79_PHACE|nr:unnamed protein product [Phaedon cochleariae]